MLYLTTKNGINNLILYWLFWLKIGDVCESHMHMIFEHICFWTASLWFDDLSEHKLCLLVLFLNVFFLRWLKKIKSRRNPLNVRSVQNDCKILPFFFLSHYCPATFSRSDINRLRVIGFYRLFAVNALLWCVNANGWNAFSNCVICLRFFKLMRFKYYH